MIAAARIGTKKAMTEQARSPRKTHQVEIPAWIDALILIAVVVSMAAALFVAARLGAFELNLATDTKLSWHLVRTAGITAYTLLAASTLWGLILASRIIKDWSPGPMALLIHTTVSWLAVGLSLAHAGMLLFDTYFKYKVTDLIIPFVGPYRPVEVGLGIIAAWLTLTIAISFSQRKRIGQKAWRWLHYTSYVAFLLVTAHSLGAGTDANNLGLRVLAGFFTFSTFGLLALRIVRRQKSPAKRAAA